MPNPLYNLLGGGNQPARGPAPPNPMMQMASAFADFRQKFTGDPRQTVQSLLNSGQMTQAQYNQLSGMAQQFMAALGIR